MIRGILGTPVVISTFTLLIALWGNPALAEDAAGLEGPDRASEPRGDEIVVTAIKLNEEDVHSNILRGRKQVEIPFSVSTYDESLILNLNVRTLNQLLRFDPSVQVQVGDSSFGDFVNIRGFEAGNQYAGLTELVYTAGGGRLNLQNIERIEVYRGVNALSAGSSPFADIGGTVNQVPKRPGDAPVTLINLGYDESNLPSAGIDLSRSTADGRFGVRINGFWQDGDTAVEDVTRSVLAGTINLIARPTDTLTLNVEFGAARDETGGYADNVGLGPDVTRVPRAPDPSRAYQQAWGFLRYEGTRWYASAEWKPVEALTLEAAYGEMDAEGGYLSSFGFVVDDIGTIDVLGGFCDIETKVKSGNIAARGQFNTGGIEHRPAVILGTFEREGPSRCGAIQGFQSNLYARIATPDAIRLPGITEDRFDPTSTTLTAFDDIRMFDGKVSVIAGVRYRELDDSFGTTNTATTPFGAFNYFFAPDQTVYVSYSKGLEFGGRAGLEPDITNAGEALPARQVEQAEAGVKWQFGRVLATAAVFELSRPLEFFRDNSNGTRTFVQEGTQRHRGAEFKLEGPITPALRAIAGLAYLDARIVENGVAAQQGNRPLGTPEWRASIFVEYDLPPVPGLTVSSSLIMASSSFADIDNRLKVDGYAQVDLGARYAFAVGATDLVARLSVENIADRGYWLPNTYFGLALSSPRTVKSSLTVAF
jgi:iron complex outermembrane receptor protein